MQRCSASRDARYCAACVSAPRMLVKLEELDREAEEGECERDDEAECRAQGMPHAALGGTTRVESMAGLDQ